LPSAATESMAKMTGSLLSRGSDSDQPAGFLLSTSRRRESPMVRHGEAPAGDRTVVKPASASGTLTPNSTAAASAQAALATLKAPGTLSCGGDPLAVGQLNLRAADRSRPAAR
jgi:hypothetical protein